MIKKIFPVLSMAAVLAAMTGCSEEQTLPVGEGKIYLSTRINTDVKVESRAEEDELAAELGESTKIWISNSQGVVRKYNGIAEVPTDGVKLLSGEYTVKAWAGTAAYASFTDRWFEGSETFTVSSGSSASVEVTCKIANVVSSVKYGEELDGKLTDRTLTVSHKGGSLTFAGETETNKGYFLMPEGVTTLDYVFTATTAEGTPVEKRGTIADVLPAHEYVLNVMADKSVSDPTGGGFITIEIDESMITSDHNVTITTPPSITGYGFNLSEVQSGEKGSIGRKSVYVCAAVKLKDVVVSGLEGIEPINLVRATDDKRAEVAAKGISSVTTDVETGGQMMQVIFGADYINNLDERETPYEITIAATDDSGRSTTAKLIMNISKAPVVTNPVDQSAVGFNSLTLSGLVAKDGVETVGFEYRTPDAADWTYVAGQASRAAFTKGQAYTAVISNLPYDTSVEYRAVSGPATAPTQFKSPLTQTVTLKSTPQLPNSGMESWTTASDNAAVPVASFTSPWTWDCGNHGSQTMKMNVTEKSSEKKHSGSYSAKLVSQFVGVGALGKFACGNLVYGHYLETQGTDGVFGFGNKFDFQGLRPKELRLWMHYTPGAATKTYKKTENKVETVLLNKGDMDIANIFIALFSGPNTTDGTYAGQYGFVVRTKDAASIFNPDAKNIIGYGAVDLAEATSGNDMVELTIPITYKNDTANIWGIAVVCAASKYGDYFAGGEGSTLYVDDFKLVY